MSLWEIVKQEKCTSLAICGLAKNTGKTVTLNYVVDAAIQDGISPGLTSIGRDGEMWDILSNKRKPPIQVKPGMLLATAEKTLAATTATLQLIRRTGLSTAMGEVVIVRAQSSGMVELAGPSRIKHMITVINTLRDMGVRLVLVDGAMDRQSFAAPRVAEAFIMATGAILSGSLAEVVKITRARIQQFVLPVLPADMKGLYQPAYVVVVAGGNQQKYPTSVMLEEGIVFWKSFGRKISRIILGGVLLNSTLSTLMMSGVDFKGMRLVVRDATCLFVDEDLLESFLKNRGTIEVIEPMTPLAVTINPTSPESQDFDSRTFFSAMRQALPGIPVYDLVQGYST